ncbi:MAG: DUF86 domain-containing protein [Nanoarchaeota archaeon]
MKKVKLFDDLNHSLQDLKEILPSEEELLESKIHQYSVSMLMMNIINLCVDIGNEIISLKQFGYPESYRDVFNILEKNKILSRPVANKMKNLVGLRNLIAHEYGEINFELLYGQAEDLNLIEVFISETIKHFR